MEIILKQNIDKLGYVNEVVTVKPGYARNYLIPQGYAIVATPSAKKMLAENLKQRAHKEAKIKEEKEALLNKITALTIKVPAKVGENGKIFGSVTNVQIADAIKAAGVDVERKTITIKGDAIKEVGSYNATVNLHKEVKGEFSFEVIEG